MFWISNSDQNSPKNCGHFSSSSSSTYPEPLATKIRNIEKFGGNWWERKWLYEMRNPGKLYSDWEKENPTEKTFFKKEQFSPRVWEAFKKDKKVSQEKTVDATMGGGPENGKKDFEDKMDILPTPPSLACFFLSLARSMQQHPQHPPF